MYGNFNQNPYGMGGYPTMQNRLASLEQTYQQYNRPQQNPMSALSGRLVTGMEEARASQIPLDGSISYFPSPAENKIYAKGIDMNGLPIFMTYILDCPKSTIKMQNSPQNEVFGELDCRISAIEQKLKEMEKRDESNANVINAQQ